MKKILFLLLIVTCGKISGQVNLQTGSATFSLPMFNWQDHKSRLNSVVALNYNSSNGLKVNDVASNAGQGWNLLAGGMITRIQHGQPDDQLEKVGNGTIEENAKYPAGYLYDPLSATLGVPLAQIHYPIFKDKNHRYKQHNSVGADKELDHFAFQFNGRSGVFVIDKGTYNATNHTGVGVSLGDSKIKITFGTVDNMSGIRTTISSFTIQDENGLKYKFGKHQLTKVLKISYCDKDLNKISQPKFKNNRVYYETSYEDAEISNPHIINGWYLTEIEDPLTLRKISLHYIDRNITTADGLSISNHSSDNTGIITPSKNYSIISRSKSIAKIPFIGAIIFPDGHNVVFKYGKPRVDLTGDSVLSSVGITYAGRYLSKYVVTTSYFILNRYGNPVSNYQKQCARLCLRSIKKIGVDLKADDPPYVFDYFLGSSATDDFVPPPFTHFRDIWGFYNGSNSKNGSGSSIPVTKSVTGLSNNDVKGLCFNGTNIYSAKSGYAKNGLLKQITYPTGGSLNYEYAQTSFFQNNQNTIIGGVNVSKTSITDGGYQNDCNNAITTNYRYSLNAENTQSSYWGFETPVNSYTIYNSYVPKDKYFYYRPPLSFGCDFRYKYPGILSREQAVNISWIAQIIQTAMDIVSTVATIIDIVKVIGGGDPVVMIILIILEIGYTCISDHHVNNSTLIYYNADLNASNPLPAQFKRVEVVENTGSNGKTVYEFTNPEHYPIWFQNNDMYSARQRFAYWAYGLPKRITLYDAAGNPVKETINIYDTSKSLTRVGRISHVHYSTSFVCCKSKVEKSTSLKYTDWSNPSIYNDLNSYITDRTSHPDIEAELYVIHTGRTELDTTYERIYKQGSSTLFLETMTDYDYSINNFQVKRITSTQSNGNKSFREIEYSGDAISGIFINNNILHVPLKTINGVTKGFQDYFLDEKVTEFITVGNGDLKPSRILEKRFNQPSLTLNAAAKETQTFTYDATGNLTGLKDEGNHVVTNIYDYDDKYVTASVVNAEPVTDKSAYSSFETNELGGWLTLNGSNYITSSSVTGIRSFSLASSHSLFTALNTAKPYKLSLWASSGGTVTVSNGTLIKSAPLVNGFTYFEYNISQGNSSVTVSGNATIDELRVYPENARMRTVTYDPLVGKTSECDENNRITYYEYDDNSRLRFIKDENRHIVKMYEYNVAKRPTGCPVTYSNLAVSEIFIKQCSAGYAPDSVTYTIPAGTFTSAASQEAVDLQVQNQLNTYGQAYANANGVCTALFYNTLLSLTFTKEGCDIGYKGTTITYTVPAGKYSSKISQADANEQAQDDMDANAQAFANFPGNATCVVSTDSEWVGTGLEECQNGHKMVQVIDENPNSSSYNQTQWVDTGTDASCGSSSCDSNSCTGVDKRCVNGSCETGWKVYTDTYYDEVTNRWVCTYHYEWSDDYWSQDYYEVSYFQCYSL